MAESRSRGTGVRAPCPCNHPHWGVSQGSGPLCSSPLYLSPTRATIPHQRRMASTPRPPGSQPEVTGFPRAHLAMCGAISASQKSAGGSGGSREECVCELSPFLFSLCSPMDRTATWEARVEHREAAATGSSDGGKRCCPSPRDA